MGGMARRATGQTKTIEKIPKERLKGSPQNEGSARRRTSRLEKGHKIVIKLNTKTKHSN